MPGVDLALDLPSLSDTLSDIVAKLVIAVDAIGDDLAPQVVPAEININGALSMNGSSLTNAGSVQFTSGNDPTIPGSIFYSGGEFYAIDSAGTIQLTASGALNFASAGGIVGDYGGVNPAAVSFDDISGEYRFTEDTGVYADLVADDLVLHSATGSVRFGVTNAITTDRSFLIKGLPTSGTGILIYDASDSSVSATGGSSGDLAVETLSLTNPILHDDFTIFVPSTGGRIVVATATYTESSSAIVQTSAGQLEWYCWPTLPTGTSIKSAKAVFNKATSLLGILSDGYGTQSLTGLTDTAGDPIVGVNSVLDNSSATGVVGEVTATRVIEAYDLFAAYIADVGLVQANLTTLAMDQSGVVVVLAENTASFAGTLITYNRLA